MESIQNIDEFEIDEAPIREAFTVDDDAKADWALRKLRSLRRKQEQNQKLAEAEVQRVSEWLSKVNTDLENDARYFEAILTPYALLQRSEGRKSVVLPHGTLKTLAGRAKVEIENADEFIKWAEENNPLLLRIKKEPDKKALSELITEDNQVISTEGEIIPAVKVLPAETSVSFVIAD
jgi:hypothetical protein